MTGAQLWWRGLQLTVLLGVAWMVLGAAFEAGRRLARRLLPRLAPPGVTGLNARQPGVTPPPSARFQDGSTAGVDFWPCGCSIVYLPQRPQGKLLRCPRHHAVRGDFAQWSKELTQ